MLTINEIEFANDLAYRMIDKSTLNYDAFEKTKSSILKLLDKHQVRNKDIIYFEVRIPEWSTHFHITMYLSSLDEDGLSNRIQLALEGKYPAMEINEVIFSDLFIDRIKERNPLMYGPFSAKARGFKDSNPIELDLNIYPVDSY